MDNIMWKMIENGSYVGTSFIDACFSPVALPYTIIMIILLIGLCYAAWKEQLSIVPFFGQKR